MKVGISLMAKKDDNGKYINVSMGDTTIAFIHPNGAISFVANPNLNVEESADILNVQRNFNLFYNNIERK